MCSYSPDSIATYSSNEKGNGMPFATSSISSNISSAGSRNSSGWRAPYSLVPQIPTPASSPQNPTGTESAKFPSQKIEKRPNPVEFSILRNDNTSARSVRTIATAPNVNEETPGLLSKDRLYGPSHYGSSFNQFDKMIVFASNPDLHHKVSSRGADSVSEVHDLLYKCKNLAKGIKSQRPSKWHLNDHLEGSLPPRSVADRLKSRYFRNFESAYRILHIPSFDHSYERFWTERKQVDDGAMVLILLVMAIGACFFVDPHEETQIRLDAVKWIYTAQSWLSDLVEKKRLSMIGLQVHCLLLLAQQTNYVGSNLVWVSMGSLVRTAIHMGLHRDPVKYPKISPLNVEIRRRLWATIMEMAVQTSLDDGMPPLISLDDFDTQTPSNLNDDEILEDMKNPPKPRSKGILTQTSMQIHLMQSFRTRLEVARLTNHFRSNPTYEDILRLDSELSEVLREFALQVQLCSSAISVEEPSVFQRNLVEHLLRRSILALHRPFAIKALKDPRYYFSRKICLEQALLICTLSADDDYSRISAFGGGLYREIMTHCGLTLCLELITQLQEDERNMALERNKSQRKPIREAINRIIDISKERLHLGETNVKGFLFLSMAMGQIEATEAGTSPEEGILSAAKQSIATGHEILKSRLPVGMVDKSSELENNHQDGNNQETLDGNGQEPGIGLLLDGTNFDLNFEDPASWLFPAFDEVPWYSRQWDPGP